MRDHRLLQRFVWAVTSPERRAYAKLQALDAADTLAFLRVPPSNRLEPLRGDREGQWSTRINDQANRTARDRCGSFLTASYTGFQRIGTDWGQV
jgi:hypothetical protein